ncbi:MAG TPA: hypothetical protein VGX72_14520 [Solirubrobacteraceae bacterium]|nr:hypothetical protein [Solirubrobacteraceae bacterium]
MKSLGTVLLDLTENLGDERGEAELTSDSHPAALEDRSSSVDAADVPGQDSTAFETGSNLVHVDVRRGSSGSFEGASISISDPDVNQLFGELMLEFATLIQGPKRGDIVMSSLLITVVASFDALVGDLAAAYFRTHPGAMGDSPEFSLKDLSNFETLDDARDELVTRKVDGLDRSIDELTQWFNKRLKIDLRRLAMSWEGFVEINQRRHLLVHTGGRVSRRYLHKVPAAEGLHVGEMVKVDAAYLNAAIDEFLAMGTNLAFAVWFGLANDAKAAGEGMLMAARRLARSARWDVVRSLSTIAAKIEAPQDLALNFQVMSWLATSKLDEPIRIEVEVREWDVSALAPSWKLARLCLLGETEAAAAMAVELINDEEISPITLLIDPLSEDLRADQTVKSTIEARGIAHPPKSVT